VVVFRGLPGGQQTRPAEPRVRRAGCPLRVTGFDRPRPTSPTGDPADGDVGAEIDGEGSTAAAALALRPVYVARINHGGILRPLRLPARGGRLHRPDRRLRIAADELKSRIAGRSVIYRFASTPATLLRQARRAQDLRMASRARSSQQIDRYPPVVHPDRLRAPGTGRRS
jgi:hypothetical protein